MSLNQTLSIKRNNANNQYFDCRLYHVFDPVWKSIGVPRKIHQTNYDPKKQSYETSSYV